MIRASIADDFFYLWSIPFQQSGDLVTRDVAAVRFEDRAWLAVAAVRFRSLQLGPLPIGFNAVVAALLLICDYRDRRGEISRGNYFLRAVTNSPTIALGGRLFGHGFGERAEIGLDSTGGLELPRVAVRLGEPASEESAARVRHLFAGNHSGILRWKARARYCTLRKDHWNMEVRQLIVTRCDWLEGLDARAEAGFDTSSNTGRWSRPMRVQKISSAG
jgi:hypothetical protein